LEKARTYTPISDTHVTSDDIERAAKEIEDEEKSDQKIQ
jgi:hypothetical protein